MGTTDLDIFDPGAILELDGTYRVGGNFWLAGGIGFCDEGDWDFPEDVLDDDWCAACVVSLGLTGTYPPEDLDIEINGPDIECAGP